MADERDFLARWSKRKALARSGRLADEEDAPAAPEPVQAEPPEVSAADAQPVEDDAALPEELRDIDIDKLDYDFDYTVFLKAGVPEAMRKKALRRLWRSNPVLACLDGLNDYEEDFTDLGIDSRGLASAYRVGKGYLFDDEPAEGDAGDEPSEPEVSEAEVADAESAEAEGTETGDEPSGPETAEVEDDRPEPEAAELADAEPVPPAKAQPSGEA